MPFATTTAQPSTTPPVTVEFAGLLLLTPGAGDTCYVGVHRRTLTHTFQVTLIVSKPNRPPTLVRLFTGPLQDTDFLIRLHPDQAGNFKAYAATAGELPRNQTSAANYPLDYRWRLNLRELHRDAQLNAGARPHVILKTGVLYTPTLTHEDLNPRFVKNSSTIPLYRFSADLAASIQPPANTRVRLEWSELGEARQLTLPRDGDPAGTTYTVSVMNDPPLSAPEAHDEIADFYKILDARGVPIPVGDRWRLEYDTSFERTDEIPCMPGTLEP